MKKFFLTGLALLIVSGLVFTSCSEEENINTNESQHLSDLSASRLTSNYGSLEFENKTVTINKTGYSKYVNDSLKYDFEYEEEIDYVINETANGAIISNIDDSNEFFKIQNFKLEDDRITFDVLNSNDQLFENIVYYANAETLEQAKFCHLCVVLGPIVIDALVDILSESDCQTAINACLKAGGLPSTTITNGIFGSSCSVNCKPKR